MLPKLRMHMHVLERDGPPVLASAESPTGIQTEDLSRSISASIAFSAYIGIDPTRSTTTNFQVSGRTWAMKGMEYCMQLTITPNDYLRICESYVQYQNYGSKRRQQVTAVNMGMSTSFRHQVQAMARESVQQTGYKLLQTGITDNKIQSQTRA